MKRELSIHLDNEKGSALIMAVLVLMVVTVIGILASRTALIEQTVATHDKVHKMTWYATDAAVVGMLPELIEQNIADRGFGDDSPPFPYGSGGYLSVYTSKFYLNDVCAIPSDSNRDIQMNGLSNTSIYISVFGSTTLAPGNAIQLPEGYHGRGKGLAGGGAQIIYTIRGLGNGTANSSALSATGWRHLT